MARRYFSMFDLRPEAVLSQLYVRIGIWMFIDVQYGNRFQNICLICSSVS